MMRAGTSGQGARQTNARLLSLPPAVFVIAALGMAGLMLVAGQYGFHRDELYFIVAGQHPAWGYVDQPPLTPILSALGVAVFGTTPSAIRLLPTLMFGMSIVLTAAMAREMGGRRLAPEIAALAIAVSGLMMAGHIAATATYDIAAWVVISWLVVRIFGGADQRLWLVVGVAAGVGLLNKYTILLLPIGLAAGILLERRWSIVRSPWPWAAAAIALVLWAPNLAWQATHDFPQLTMAQQIADAAGGENRAQFIPVLILLIGPLLWPVVLLGLWRMFTARELRPWRPFATAFVVALALTWLERGKAYYVLGLLPVLFAAGSIPVAAWVSRGRLQRVRLAGFGAVAGVSGALVAVLVLPILPPATRVSSGVHDINTESAEEIGWPDLVASVRDVVSGLSVEERSAAVIITDNYAEAGAIELLGDGLPPVYSGHNSYWDFGTPPDGTSVVVVVGTPRAPAVGGCRREASITNPERVPNDEYGKPIAVCRTVPESWADVWPDYRHVD
jgi:hypothetical protein